MKDPKIWNILGWISFVLFAITLVIYYFVDENYIEAPTWLIASVACWFYADHLGGAEETAIIGAPRKKIKRFYAEHLGGSEAEEE